METSLFNIFKTTNVTKSTKAILESSYILLQGTGVKHRVRLVRFPPYQIFLIKKSFFYNFIQKMKLSFAFHMKFQIQYWSLLFTFILLCFYMMQRSKDNHVRLPYFTRTFFLRLMQCDDLMHKLTMQVECFIYIVVSRRVLLSGEAVR